MKVGLSDCGRTVLSKIEKGMVLVIMRELHIISETSKVPRDLFCLTMICSRSNMHCVLLCIASASFYFTGYIYVLNR